MTPEQTELALCALLAAATLLTWLSCAVIAYVVRG